MKKLIIIILLLAAAYLGATRSGVVADAGSGTSGNSLAVDSKLASAITNRKSGVPVQGEGLVTKVLADDNKGSRHQRFIVRLATGQTLLIAHNIDLARRVEPLQAGDRIEFYGDYEWNPKGGVIHWTHHDPAGRHASGWLKRAGQTYD